MNWLSSPKVRLALIVNGLYFISLFTPAAQHTRPRLLAHARAPRAEREASPDYVPISPPSGPSRASAFESGGMLHVSLNNDLTLVKRRDHTLMLSPSFVARPTLSAVPESVRLNFIIYSDSDAVTCPGGCPLSIKADAQVLWSEDPSAANPGGGAYRWKRQSVPHSSNKLEDGSVVETMAAESFSVDLPYDTFLDMISAKRVVVRLGPDRVELTADQIEALRDMHRRLPQPPAPGDSDPN